MQWMGIRVSNGFLPSSLAVSFAFSLSFYQSLSLVFLLLFLSGSLSLRCSLAFPFGFPFGTCSASWPPPIINFLEMPQAHGTPAESEG